MSQNAVASGPTVTPNYPVIPGCRIISIAGQGGMGTVYRAEQAAPRRIVAVKVLSQTVASPDKLAAFQREAETIARLEHPGILPVYGFGESEGRPYLVLRYLGGGSVATLIRKGPIEVATAARWVRTVAGALAFAHAHGLVHRDVKPSNMLLDEAGNAYLTDFGIAAASDAVSGFASGGNQAAIGSAAYMSPEQGSGQAADPRADLYSLAVSLYEMVTGQPPYTAETPLGVIVRHINDPIPSARAVNPTVPAAVDALIQRGMAKNPAGRPPTAAEFARLLGEALAAPDMPLAANMAEPPPTLLADQPGAAPARRGPSPLLWVGIGLVAVCLLGVLALGGGGALFAILAAPRASATPLATITAIVEPTLTVEPTPAGQLLAVDFASGRGGFGLQAPDDSGGITHANGRLQFSVLQSGAEFYSTSGRVQAQDIKLEVDVQQTAGPGQSEFGAICRWQDGDNFTAFAISGAGQFKIWQRTNGANLRLIDWTDAGALASSARAAHHLTILCAGTKLSLAVDGAVLGETEDPGAVKGDVAVFAGLRAAGKLAVDFTKVSASQP